MKNNWKESFKDSFLDSSGDWHKTTPLHVEYFITKLLEEQKKELLESQIDKIKHEYNGYGGVLGFKCNDLIRLILKHHE